MPGSSTDLLPPRVPLTFNLTHLQLSAWSHWLLLSCLTAVGFCDQCSSEHHPLWAGLAAPFWQLAAPCPETGQPPLSAVCHCLCALSRAGSTLFDILSANPEPHTALEALLCLPHTGYGDCLCCGKSDMLAIPLSLFSFIQVLLNMFWEAT